MMYLHPRCLGRSSVSLAVSLGVSLGVSLAVSLWVWFVVILAAGLLAAGLLAALYLRRLTWQACWRRACWRQHHTPAAPKLARRGAQAGDGGSCKSFTVGRRQHIGARLLRIRSAGGSTSGLICYGTVGRRQHIGAHLLRSGRRAAGFFGVRLPRSGRRRAFRLRRGALLRRAYRRSRAALAFVARCRAAENPAALPPYPPQNSPEQLPLCLPALRRPAPSSCLSASLSYADQPRAAASLPP